MPRRQNDEKQQPVQSVGDRGPLFHQQRDGHQRVLERRAQLFGAWKTACTGISISHSGT